MARVAPAKRELVKNLVREMDSSGVVGVLNISGIPAPQFQDMRRKLQGKAKIHVTKNNLIRIALKEASGRKTGLEKLSEMVAGQSAVVLASINPFKLFREMESTKTKAPAKGGEIAPDDIWVREGETSFKPGPVVGELQKAGIPAAIDRGKVVIKKDKLLVKKGDKIPRDVAQMLTRLEIFPMIVGLDLRGAYEGGTLFPRDILSFDDAKLRADVALAGSQVFGLAMRLAYPTKATINALLSRAHQQALSLSVRSGFPVKETTGLLLAQAQGHMFALASRVPAALDDELKSKLSSAPPPASEGGEEKKKGEKVSEEEAATGLGSLFG